MPLLFTLLLTFPTASYADAKVDWLYGYSIDLYQNHSTRAEEFLKAFLAKYPEDSRVAGIAFRLAELRRTAGNKIGYQQVVDSTFLHLAQIGSPDEADALLQEILKISEESGDTSVVDRARADEHLSSLPSFGRARFESARRAFIAGDSEQAERLLDLVAPDASIDRTLFIYMRAVLKLRRGDTVSALAVLDAPPDDPAHVDLSHPLAFDCLALKADLNYDARRYGIALASVETINAHWPDSMTERLDRIQVLSLLEEKKFPEASQTALTLYGKYHAQVYVDAAIEAWRSHPHPAADLDTVLRLVANPIETATVERLAHPYAAAFENCGCIAPLRTFCGALVAGGFDGVVVDLMQSWTKAGKAEKALAIASIWGDSSPVVVEMIRAGALLSLDRNEEAAAAALRILEGVEANSAQQLEARDIFLRSSERDTGFMIKELARFDNESLPVEIRRIAWKTAIAASHRASDWRGVLARFEPHDELLRGDVDYGRLVFMAAEASHALRNDTAAMTRYLAVASTGDISMMTLANLRAAEIGLDNGMELPKVEEALSAVLARGQASPSDLSDDDYAHAEYLSGLLLLTRGKPDDARMKWKSVIDRWPTISWANSSRDMISTLDKPDDPVHVEIK